MIFSYGELQPTNEYLDEQNQCSARMHLKLRLPAAKLTTLPVKAVLYIKEHPNNHLNEAYPWTEQEWLIIDAKHAHQFIQFQYVFGAETQYDLRLDFCLVDTTLSQPDQSIGYVSTTLSALLSAERERIELDVLSAPDYLRYGNAHLKISWIRFRDDRIDLEMRFKIVKKYGWPFYTARPFFVLYRWEASNSSWTTLYRSEILLPPGRFSQSQDCLVFQVAELFFENTISKKDDMPLRIEFFHYKPGRCPKLLAYYVTSLRAMRQAKRGSCLKLNLNSFPEGDPVGQLRMVNSKMSEGASYFCLKAQFGGNVITDFVYFDLSLKNESMNGVKGLKKGLVSRPFFTICRYSDFGTWDQMYRSETLYRPTRDRVYRYEVAKLTKRKLFEERKRRFLLFIFYHHVDQKEVEIGHIETTTAALLETELGIILPLWSRISDETGYVTLTQNEGAESRLYFAIHCVVGSPRPKNIFTLTSEMGPVADNERRKDDEDQNNKQELTGSKAGSSSL